MGDAAGVGGGSVIQDDSSCLHLFHRLGSVEGSAGKQGGGWVVVEQREGRL